MTKKIGSPYSNYTINPLLAGTMFELFRKGGMTLDPDLGVFLLTKDRS